MNIPKTDLVSISLLVQGKPTDAAFPKNLSDVVLHQIARDLLLCEIAFTNAETVTSPPAAGPMFLVGHMLLSEAAKLNGRSSFVLSEDRLKYWLPRYMFYVERELVARTLKIERKNDSQALLKEVRSQVS
jgi:hypothetical protein